VEISHKLQVQNFHLLTKGFQDLNPVNFWPWDVMKYKQQQQQPFHMNLHIC